MNKKQEKRTSCQLKVHTVVITKEWTKISYNTSSHKKQLAIVHATQ